VRNHLAKHYQQFGKEPPEKEVASASGEWRAKDNPSPHLVFTPLEEIEKAIARQIEAVDFHALAQQAVDRARGRV